MLEFKWKRRTIFAIIISWFFIFLIPRLLSLDLPPYIFWPWFFLALLLPWSTIYLGRKWQMHIKNESTMIFLWTVFSGYFILTTFF